MMAVSFSSPGFPYRRQRRLRQNPVLRQMVRETELNPSDLIYPLFVTYGQDKVEPVPSLPGVSRYSVDRLLPEAEELVELGIPAVILFGIPENKDFVGSGAWDPQGPVPRAVRALKQHFPQLVVICDVCLCEYTSHGHCGLPDESGGRIANDPSLELLARAALCYAEAGADLVAPSDMMDGRVRAIREKLDANGFVQVAIMAYSAKYASSFYGPFREAAGSAPAFGDRRSYQMDPPNRREALLEAALDWQEGADIIMVKPALAYLDVVKEIKQQFPCPVATYNVSGEYAMVKAAAARGWLDERAVVLEMLTAMKRAGADLILTYYAPDVARWLAEA